MISVLMGLHRIDKYVFPAIESVLSQANIELELVIVANGRNSSEISYEIINNFPDERRIRIIETPIAQLAHALNIALTHAKYDYVARMDADDVSHPERLKKQLDYLILNNLDFVGSAVRLIDADGSELGFRIMPTKGKINKLLLFKNCFIHPTVLAKKKLLLDVGGYNSGFNSEDYDLWLRLLRGNVLWDNINHPLLDYRIHSAASQRRLLGYAEVSGLILREFILAKSFCLFIAVWSAILKSLFRSR